jgi:hypothetical protein
VKQVDLSNPHVSLIGSRQLAQVMGISPTTLCTSVQANRGGIKSAQFSRGIFMVAKLRGLGLLGQPNAPAAQVTP